MVILLKTLVFAINISLALNLVVDEGGVYVNDRKSFGWTIAIILFFAANAFFVWN